MHPASNMLPLYICYHHDILGKDFYDEYTKVKYYTCNSLNSHICRQL